MRILITGASGFIGGRFAAHALAQGHTVRCSGRNADAMRWLSDRGAECLSGNLLDIDFAHSASKSCEAIVHCAGAVGTWGSYQHFYNANVQVTENVLLAAKSAGTRRVVHLSSPSIYFDG